MPECFALAASFVEEHPRLMQRVFGGTRGNPFRKGDWKSNISKSPNAQNWVTERGGRVQVTSSQKNKV